jgi:putative DNA primase/helicase
MGDYAGSAPDSLLTLNQHQEHPTEVADLQGKRLVVASETEAHARLRTQLIKKITGESTIKARRMYGNYFEFRRTSKIFLQTNNKPLIREDTEAVWRRIHLVPFMATIPAAERDPRLMERLREEAPGILAWLVRGCLEWQHAGLQPPQEVAEATRSYREESDPLADFINDCCAIDPDFVTATGELRRAYEAYCTEKGMRPVGGRTFAERLQQLQCTADRNASGRFWRGIALVDTAANFMGCHVED